MKTKTYPKYGNDAYLKNKKEITKANSTKSAKKEIKKIKKELFLESSRRNFELEFPLKKELIKLKNKKLNSLNLIENHDVYEKSAFSIGFDTAAEYILKKLKGK